MSIAYANTQKFKPRMTTELLGALIMQMNAYVESVVSSPEIVSAELFACDYLGEMSFRFYKQKIGAEHKAKTEVKITLRPVEVYVLYHFLDKSSLESFQELYFELHHYYANYLYVIKDAPLRNCVHIPTLSEQ